MSARDPGKIAVFRALFLGDLLLAVPAFRALRTRFPAAEITYIGLAWAQAFAERFRLYIDRFLPFPGYPGIDEVPLDVDRTARFLVDQQSYRYDLALQMHGSGLTSNPFVVALGAAETAGYYTGDRPAGLTRAAPYPENQPEVWRNLGLAGLAGCSDLACDLEFPILREDRIEAYRVLHGLATSGPLIGLHPGAKTPARRWPADQYAALGDELASRFGARIVLTGGQGEEELVREVARLMSFPPLLAAGKTSLGGLAALIAGMDLFISNCTGPAHLADAVDTPSIIIAGPSEHVRWAPLDDRRHQVIRQQVSCSPCAFWQCPIDHRCLRRITPRHVLAVAERILPGRGLAVS